MRWDFHRYLNLDLDDWLRGERNWCDFWELKEQLPGGSHYRAALLQDPDMVEALANLPEPKEHRPPPLEDYGPLLQRVDTLIDRVTQLLFLTGHQDPSRAPQTPRPQLPHEEMRRKLRKSQLRILTANFE